jgi:hypothetical protein
MKYFFYFCHEQSQILTMSIININKLVEKAGGKNHYSYIRVRNMLNGMKGRSTDKEIQQVRKILKDELSQLINTLDNL